MIVDKFVKITSEDVLEAIEARNSDVLPLVEWIYHTYFIESSSRELSLQEALIDCESPIEQAFSIELTTMPLHLYSRFTGGMIDVDGVHKQMTVQAEGKNYRVDFMIPVVYRTSENNYCKTFIVECDGHDYHEKTKEQIAKNNQRERDLKAAGYEVIRFSGSDIYKSVYKCVLDLMKIIFKYWLDLHDKEVLDSK